MGFTVSDAVTMTSGELRQLRCRMGWCQAEMARRLECDVDLVGKYESGEVELLEPHRRVLSLLFHQAENESMRVHRRPVAEILMRDRKISQIHDMDVQASWSREIGAGSPVKTRLGPGEA